MKRIACFCIPAHGHTNPMLPVAAELVRRGNAVRFYSFDAFAEKIRATGAEYVSCDAFLPPLTPRQEAGLKRVSTTEMTLQDIRITLEMDAFLTREFACFRPDVVYTDSVCFWGKLSAWKHRVPMVVSTSTFAFNQLSSAYMKNSPREMADLLFGLPRIAKALRQLQPLGYPKTGALALVQSDNQTDSVVYTSRRFQPYANSFSAHYAFVGPSVFSSALPEKQKERPLVYVSLGTVLRERPAFFKACVEALRDLDADVIFSCGNAADPDALGALPGHIRAYPTVDQLAVLAKADVFLTHCGMNSVSESLYMAAPMVLYPQTGEQQAVARRVAELGAGTPLTDDSPKGIRAAVQEILSRPRYAAAAKACSADLRACPGPAGAAAFLKQAPHAADIADPLAALRKAAGKYQLLYWLAAAAAVCLVGVCLGWRFAWMPGVLAGALSAPVDKAIQKRAYQSLPERTE